MVDRGSSYNFDESYMFSPNDTWISAQLPPNGKRGGGGHLYPTPMRGVGICPIRLWDAQVLWRKHYEEFVPDTQTIRLP
jgi:hypothetical protein